MEQELRERIAVNVRRLRGTKSQLAVAARAGLTQAAISNYESGKRTPTLMAVLKLADAYGVPLDDILNGDRS